MIFPVLEIESVVQVNDKTRLDATKSFVTPDEASISLVEIQPSAGDAFIDVTQNKYLDWQYSTDGAAITVVVRITTDGAPTTFSKTLTVKSVADDKLFSTDAELISYEPDLLNYVRAGRSSFLDVHRTSQQRILKVLDENGFWNKDKSTITLDEILTIDDFVDWSKFMTLRLIFEGLSNATDDIFHEKALRYKNMEAEARDRARFRIDTDKDGEQEEEEDISFRTIEFEKI